MIKSYLAKTLVAATALGFASVVALPASAEDIPATPMNHSGFSMPMSGSAGLAPPPPAAPAEPAMPEKPMKQKRMAKKKMMKKSADGAAPAAGDGKM